MLASVDAMTCLLAGFTIFSILGNLALSQGKTVEDVVKEGKCALAIVFFITFILTLKIFLPTVMMNILLLNINFSY